RLPAEPSCYHMQDSSNAGNDRPRHALLLPSHAVLTIALPGSIQPREYLRERYWSPPSGVVWGCISVAAGERWVVELGTAAAGLAVAVGCRRCATDRATPACWRPRSRRS